ncbi:MAG: exopolyphosphatase [Candidatus Thermochlorobacter aerophilum]|jgi:oligoribonuclease NrnB/cAMP/cGMP phosphodiesterase (DHH superfamily)|uniref:Exopolyphosphatase n=1 Tax=Candidatus Thermochlorobacter aerophilus TaxID=1868324 RepID=A0A395M3M8_9BACT|nr:MAG: exopolyphosphatase [Candidatus Thermochlorobacter aerophilum]RFM25519.1 MAG: exopolyphosphatase [Candidatus Thermochlorobacter aerophilum]
MKYNVLTRADLDGLVCAVILKNTEDIERVRFSEPKFVQDREIEVYPNDIITNLPYHPNCAMWFDHHAANVRPKEFKGAFKTAPSAARVVYDYYLPRFPHLTKYEDLIRQTDRIDMADLTYEEVLSPSGYLLLSMTIDGKYHEDEPYWLHLIDLLKDKSLDEIMQDPQVVEKCNKFREDDLNFRDAVRKHSRVEKNVLITDLRSYGENLPNGNRYFVYAFQSTTNLSMRITPDRERPGMVSIGVGYNIFNRTANINVGELMKKYGGGGHKTVGSTKVKAEDADRIIQEILTYLTR